MFSYGRTDGITEGKYEPGVLYKDFFLQRSTFKSLSNHFQGPALLFPFHIIRPEFTEQNKPA